MNTLKRIIPLLLVLVLTLGLLPLSAFAVGDEVIPAEEPCGEITEASSSSKASPNEQEDEPVLLTAPPAETGDDNVSAPGAASETQDEPAPPESVPLDVGEPAPEAEESEPLQADDLDAGESSPVPEETDLPDSTPPADDPADDPVSDQDDLAAPPTPEAEADDEAAELSPEATDEPAPEPTTEPTPEPTTEPSPEPTVEPTPTAKPRTGRNILPDPIPGYDPLDPSNPYPYGEPVDNFYPPEFDVEDPNGINLMSQGSIPDSMWDNSILRALAYTGFNVQKLKDNDWLYKYEYISTNLPSHDSSILSNIGYGEYPNGDETVSDGSTPTGKAPNISYFESNGLVCASFVNYYVNNYLRNIEGVDTSAISSALGKVGTSVRVVSTWVSALTSLASDPNSGVTRYTSADTAYANLVPGDIIAFKNDSGTWMHLAVYAGTYTLYRTSGSSIGTYHFIIHVGNDRGPEISTAEFMANAGAKSSKPAEWYHLSFNTTQKGDLKIVKTSDDGNVSGITFTIQGGSVNQTVTTGSDGSITVPGLKPGTYTVTETVPDGYSSSAASQTVTVKYDQTATVNFHNSLKMGNLKIIKKSDDGKVSGIQFTITGNGVNKTVISGADGTIVENGLKPGTYNVTEKVPDGYVCDNATQSVTVKYDQTASVTFNNKLKTGDVKIVKTSDDGKDRPLRPGFLCRAVPDTVPAGK